MYEEGTQDIVDYMVVDGNEYDIHPSNRLETCDHNPGEEPIGMFSQVGKQTFVILILGNSYSDIVD